MPITLPPITRRRFLKTSALAALTLSIRNSFADTGTAKTDYWALLSDPHLAADASAVSRNTNMAANLKKALGMVNSGSDLPSNLLLNGDCAFDTGESADYAALVAQFATVRESGLPIHITLGNHDNRENFAKALNCTGDVGKVVPNHYVSLVEGKTANWFVLDSLIKTKTTPGQIGAEQLAWLAAQLDLRKDQPAIVVVHHNPFFGGEKNSGVLDTAQLMETIRPRRQVKALIYGHTHKWQTTKDESGIHLINLPPVAYVFEEGQPSGWVKARVGESAIALELCCIDPKHPANGQKVNLSWRT